MSDFFNKYPYTDFHELNLDWIIKRVKKLTEDWIQTAADWTSTEEAWNDLHDYVMNYFNNLDLQEEVNHKIDAMAADGSLDALLLPYFNQYKEDINNIVSGQDGRIAVLESRMDSFASLTEGSTTGDAELMDIRVAADGETYPTAGDAVRAQVDELQHQINDNDAQFIPSVNLLNPSEYQKGGYYNSSGAWVVNNTVDSSNFIEVAANDVCYFNFFGTGLVTASYFNATKTFISRVSGINPSTTPLSVPNDSNIKYVVVSFSATNQNYNELMFCKDIRPTKYMSYADVDLVFNSLKNRNIALLGDSITATEKRWVKQFIKRLSPASVTNLAVSGAHLRDYINTPYPYDGNPSSSDQVSNVLGNQVQKLINGVGNNTYVSPDTIFIFIGTNDNWNYESGHDIEEEFTSGNSYISISDVTRYRFAGAMRWAYENLRTLSAASEIIFITPIQCAQDVREYSQQKDKADRITEVAKRMSAKVIDAFNRSGIYGRYEYSGINSSWLIDGLHPNISGGIKLGNFIADEYCRIHLTDYYSSVASWE